MAETSPASLTVDEFLVWADGRPGHRELERVRVLAMSPERPGHVRAKTAVQRALAAAIDRAELPCEALGDGATVRIDATTAYEPDASVYCGAALPADAIGVAAPVVVVEVLSPDTARTDRRDKRVGYVAVPSIRHHLIVDPDRRIVVHPATAGDGVATRILAAGALRRGSVSG